MTSARKIPANPYAVWDVDAQPYNYSPTRKGETFRKCVDCGQDYRPTARTQKYCPECRERRKNDKRSRSGQR